jgi:16S rRNA (cytosine1402-N4)-methyltransferase
MTKHTPVLLGEAIRQLNLKGGDVVIDATLGGGGHSYEVLNKIGREGTLIAFDLDIEAIKRFAEIPSTKSQTPNLAYRQAGKSQSVSWRTNPKIQKVGNAYLVNENFAELKNVLAEIGIEKIDAILADLGWSSDQIENPEFGMSFMREGVLDMRYDRNQELTAKKIVNEYSQKDLEKIIERYGEERFAKNIAKRIIEYRKNHTIETTTQLADIVKNAVPPKNRYGKIDPATRTFQALRIETNKELENLEKFIPVAIDILNPEGRLAIITFHSLEDRIVKSIFRENAGGCVCPSDFPQCVCGKKPKVKLITKKPIAPESEEVFSNPRARSARLRVVEKEK